MKGVTSSVGLALVGRRVPLSEFAQSWAPERLHVQTLPHCFGGLSWKRRGQLLSITDMLFLTGSISNFRETHLCVILTQLSIMASTSSPHPSTMGTAWGTQSGSRLHSSYCSLWWLCTESMTTNAGPVRAPAGNFYEWDLEETRSLFSMAQKPQNAGWELLDSQLSRHIERGLRMQLTQRERSWKIGRERKNPDKAHVSLWVLAMTEARSIFGFSSHVSQ